MTIQIGIICPNEIVLASDTLITDPYGAKSYEDKISMVDFKVDDVLIAQSGVSAITKRAVELIAEKARGKAIKSPKDVTQIAEEAMREVKNHLSDDDQKEHLRQNGAALILAFYVANKPYIFRIDALLATVEPAPRHFVTAGLGSTLANYLLDELLPPKSDANLAIATAIYVLKKVKDNNAYCGGKTTCKILEPVPQYQWETGYVGKVKNISTEFVQILENRLETLDKKNKQSRNRQALSIIRKTGSELWKKHLKRVKAEEEAEELANPGLKEKRENARGFVDKCARTATPEDMENLKSGKQIKF